jgi:hypothetical protein
MRSSHCSVARSIASHFATLTFHFAPLAQFAAHEQICPRRYSDQIHGVSKATICGRKSSAAETDGLRKNQMTFPSQLLAMEPCRFPDSLNQ